MGKKKNSKNLNMNSSNEDPYNVLGVSRNASKSEIKSAYRKLALKFHPDKQRGSEEEKAKYSEKFAKIGNAYEILGDEEKRKRFDRGGMSSGGIPTSTREGFHDDFFSDSFSMFGRRNSGFTDPFELFERVFGEEFGPRSSHGRSSRNMFNHDSDPFESAFSDPFFSNAFGRGGRSMSSGFGMMNDMMNNMNSHNNGTRQFSSSFSSSSSMGGRGGIRESVSTSTRIINGKRQTVTERIRTNPDGSVNRHVETEGDDDFPHANDGGNKYLQNSSDVQRRKSSRRFF